MALKDLVAGLVVTAFEITDDLSEQITYHEQGDSAYDPATSANTAKTVVDHVISLASLPDYTASEQEKDESINGRTDIKCLFPLKDQTFTPNDNDTVTAKGVVWDIVKAKGVPGEGLAMLHLRKR